MKTIKYHDIVTPELIEGAIINREFKGFTQDYLTLHCLLKIHEPKRVLEIGTNMGMGTLIIKNALPDSKVLSMELPVGIGDLGLTQPSEGKDNSIGYKCYLEYEQIYADSMTFDYSLINPIDACYVDGNHIKENVSHETKQLVKLKVGIIIYHDTDIPGVMDGIIEGHEDSKYSLFKVENTRIVYALWNN